MSRPRGRALRRTAVVLVAAAATVAPFVVDAAPAGAGVIAVSPTGSVLVRMRGNGHGHGMSQYGARGAAVAGRSYRQILAFYYPGSTLTTLPASWIRVRLSGFGSSTSVAADSTLTVSAVHGALPTTGISRYRLVANSGTGLTLQQLKSAKGSIWTTYKTGVPNRAYFHRSNAGSIRLFATDGSSTRYFGALVAVRASGGVYPVDRVTIDHYTAGVVPREMPTSWQPAAVDAQAVAARTYGQNAVEHPLSSDYDICDSSQCQVYGGTASYDAAGTLVSGDDPKAATDTAGQVLKYRGATIFSQFSASDGGWSVDGGEPYLKAAVDPYDPGGSGDPYIDYATVVTVASVARSYGLAKITKFEITKRDGHGAWGGRVLAGFVDGTDSAKKTRRVATTGFELQAALGIGTTWFALRLPTS